MQCVALMSLSKSDYHEQKSPSRNRRQIFGNFWRIPNMTENYQISSQSISTITQPTTMMSTTTYIPAVTVSTGAALFDTLRLPFAEKMSSQTI